MLNGLLKFSTSVDFSVGDVCVPGAGDPLANVKLFQNVTPGFETESTAKSKSNQQSPLQVGVIVSNMPWDKEVYLADNDGKNARKFWFTLINSKIKYQTRQSASGSYTTTTGNNRLQFYPSRDDANTLFFETLDGGFVENCYNKLYLEARGFEWRKVVPSKELKSVSNTARKDWPYYVTGDSKGTMKSYSTSGYDWFDPTFMDENSGKQIVKEYERDTTLFSKPRPWAINSTMKWSILGHLMEKRSFQAKNMCILVREAIQHPIVCCISIGVVTICSTRLRSAIAASS